MTKEKMELQPGTLLKKCLKCDTEFVVIEELAELTPYCSPQCDGTAKESYEEDEAEKEE